MKNFVLAGAMTLASAVASQAATITFDGGPPGGTPYVEGDFTMDSVRIVNGRCDSLSGRPCAALNDNETFTLSRTDGMAFTLSSFWFQLLGNGTDNTLIVTSSAGLPAVSLPQTVWGNNDGGQVIMGADYGSYFTDVFSVTFAANDGGNIRIDDIGIEEPAPVPIPAAGLMLLTALGGAAALRRKL